MCLVDFLTGNVAYEARLVSGTLIGFEIGGDNWWIKSSASGDVISNGINYMRF